MELNTDWRRQGQEKYLTKLKLYKRVYTPFNSEWEHDHCEFCGNKFSKEEGDLKEGYTTFNGYHWICNECFNDFKEEFKWELVD